MKELDKSMYFNAKASTIEAARILRENLTHTEKILWKRLNKKQICGLRFRRQHPIDLFIADFYCHRARLVVEIDGNIHNFHNEYDIARTAEMEKYDIEVIRFSNSEVETKTEEVLKLIESKVKSRIKSPPWGPPDRWQRQSGRDLGVKPKSFFGCLWKPVFS